MPRKCSAPFCSVDDSGGIFKLFEFPGAEEVRIQWKAKMKTDPNLGSELEEQVDAYLCEAHFDVSSWEEGNEERGLLKGAVPSIFQHSSPLEYIEQVYKKLNSLHLLDEERRKVWVVVENIKSEGVLDNAQVKTELIRLGTLLVTSALQNVRIQLTSEIIDSNQRENAILSTKIEELQLKLKCVE